MSITLQISRAKPGNPREGGEREGERGGGRERWYCKGEGGLAEGRERG